MIDYLESYGCEAKVKFGNTGSPLVPASPIGYTFLVQKILGDVKITS
jgi:hypothetical protein